MELKERKITRTELDVESVRPNDWNYNKQDDFMFDKQLKSMKKHGALADIQVMRDPENPDKFIIINGEHRWKAAKELGMKTYPATIIEDITIEEAKEIGVKLNEIKGDADPVKLGEIFNSIGLSIDILKDEMPYPSIELENIMSLTEDDLILKETPEMTEAEEKLLDEENTSNIRLNVILSPRDFEVYHEVKTKLKALEDSEALVKMCEIVEAYLKTRKRRVSRRSES